MQKFMQTIENEQVESKYTDRQMALKWIDRREVCMPTTLHETIRNLQARMIDITDEDEHNENMGCYNKSDMMISSIKCVRKSLKCY